MFIDASAIVAIMIREDGHDDLIARMQAASERRTSTISLFEAMTALAKRRGLPPGLALIAVEAFVEEAEIDVQPISWKTGQLAVEAFDRYGKGRGHPAQLNMGDCFSYAAAREHGLALLYKGDDFARTDLA